MRRQAEAMEEGRKMSGQAEGMSEIDILIRPRGSDMMMILDRVTKCMTMKNVMIEGIEAETACNFGATRMHELSTCRLHEVR